MNRETFQTPAAEPSTRQRFLEAGARVFVREGYVGASMELVASEAGLSRAALYKHFDNKGDLFASVAQMIQESAAAASAEFGPEALASDIGAAEAISRFIGVRHERFCELLDTSTHADELMEESSRRCGPLIRQHAQDFRDALTDFIAQLQAAGRLLLRADTSAEHLADMLLAAQAGLKTGGASFLTPEYSAAFNRMAHTLVAGATAPDHR